MSVASATPADSARNPRQGPSSSVTVPKPNGGGTCASRTPIAVVGRAQTSPAIAASIRRADHARPVAESEQAIHRRGLRLPQEAAAECGELPIQRQAGHMGADAEQRGLVRRQRDRVRRLAATAGGGTHGRRELTVQRVGQRGEASLGPGRTEQHATDGGAPNGDGERGHVAQVGEIGERAQAAVRAVSDPPRPQPALDKTERWAAAEHRTAANSSSAWRRACCNKWKASKASTVSRRSPSSRIARVTGRARPALSRSPSRRAAVRSDTQGPS